MESPVTADEADDSYRTLGVGRSLPGSHDTKQKFACVAQKAARTSHAWSNEELCVRALLTNSRSPFSSQSPSRRPLRSASARDGTDRRESCR